MKLPNFIIIGAPKSGTTSLYYYLKQHPDIYLPDRKELHYFSADYLSQRVNGPGDRNIVQSLCRSLEDYEYFYRNATNQKMIGEVSPSYLYYDGSSEGILETLGRIKIIAILRNPIEKAYSQYMHMIRENLEQLSFEEALKAEPERKSRGWSDLWLYTESSLYAAKLDTYINRFGKENIKVLVFDDLVENPKRLLFDLFDYLEVDTTFSCDTSKIYNRTGRPRSMFIANVLSRPSVVKTAVKKLFPQSLRTAMRMTLTDINTGCKDTINPDLRKSLTRYFNEDIAKIEILLSRQLMWR